MLNRDDCGGFREESDGALTEANRRIALFLRLKSLQPNPELVVRTRRNIEREQTLVEAERNRYPFHIVDRCFLRGCLSLGHDRFI